MFILKKGHQPGVYVPLRALFLVFCWKNVRIICTAKDSHIFSAKNNSVFIMFTFKVLTKYYITTLLISKNWPLIAMSQITPMVS